ncbi:MAG: DUF4234 domain-containing protein [Ruminococcus sp.]|nr:DUF4234 domain-containing protein [Ruminococcus sp.]
MICNNCGAQFDGGVCPNCGAPSAAPAAAGASVPQRGIALCVVLSIVTLGIYMFYWMYKLNDETKIVASEPNATTGGMVVLLTIVTFGIYGFYWAFKQGERIDKAKSIRGGQQTGLSTMYLILMILLSPAALALMQNELNQMA